MGLFCIFISASTILICFIFALRVTEMIVNDIARFYGPTPGATCGNKFVVVDNEIDMGIEESKAK